MKRSETITFGKASNQQRDKEEPQHFTEEEPEKKEENQDAVLVTIVTAANIQ